MIIKPLLAVCAWCPDAAERTSEAQALGYDVTHGICHSCSARILKESAPIGTLAKVALALDSYLTECEQEWFVDEVNR